jgi:hypothetical protein
MRDSLQLIVTERNEHQARVRLVPNEGSGVAQVSGVIRGPYCEFTKTLTADFAFRPTAINDAVEALVMEPCYWTPQLPFWYDLRLKMKLQDGTESEENLTAGIKRFYCEGRNLRLESKRIVLRGCKVDSPTENDWRAARKFETVLVVTDSAEDVCQTARRLGVPLIVDMRSNQLTADRMIELDWYPAVFLVLVNADQLAEIGSHSPRQIFVAVALSADDPQPSGNCDAIVVELKQGERPPAWVATCDKPVIAIRKDSASEIKTARGGCDRLQAELAPEFDLAGYFV